MKNLFFLIVTLLFATTSCGEKKNPDIQPVDEINTFFTNEVKPMTFKKCFLGAYYRKVVSSVDVWTGISGTVILPTMNYDESRRNPNKPAQYLDNPSVYMGGNMGGQETDIGMAWEVIRYENGSVSPDRVAFRPFLRRTSHASGQTAIFQNAPAEARYYWKQGDTITMSVQIIEDFKLKFIVEGAGKRYETDFDCAGYKKGNKGEFKRVNAIDQVANEGKPAQPTTTRVENSKWLETFLYRFVENQSVKVPMHSGRFTDMRCPDIKYFQITSTEEEKKKGAESININGAGY